MRLLRAYPETFRGGDSGDFELGPERATMADQSAIRREGTTPPKLKIPLSGRFRAVLGLALRRPTGFKVGIMPPLF
jgi:hypothetical protein